MHVILTGSPKTNEQRAYPENSSLPEVHPVEYRWENQSSHNVTESGKGKAKGYFRFRHPYKVMNLGIFLIVLP